MSAAEVAKIAKSTAVAIESESSRGSGIIIQRNGNQYLVLTAAHVVRSRQQNYQAVAADDRHYQLDPASIRMLAGVDLAVVRFTSDRDYPVPKLGNTNESVEGTTIYVSGFPLGTAAIDRSVFSFTDGKVTANSSKPLKDGYSLIYSNNTLPGMSGGGVFNDKGELVAIHGKGDVDTKIKTSELNPDVRVKTGFNLGIPINTFRQLASRIGVNTGGAIALKNTQPKADDFVLAGFERVSKSDFKGSIVEFTKALELNPNLASAKFWRGACRLLAGDARGAIADLSATIARNPQKIEAYMYRGSAYAKLGNRQLAIADLDRAVALQPESDVAYSNRCSLKYQLKDFQGAIADCNRAIALNPYQRGYYSSRGSVYYQLNRYREAVADFEIAIKGDARDGFGYLNRGFARVRMGDLKGAIADYTTALKLVERDPEVTAKIYSTRGTAQYQAKNYPAAISDLSESLRLVPTEDTYFFRGNTYYESGKRAEAIADLNRAVALNPKYAAGYLLRGLVLTEDKKSRQALSDFDRAIALDPNLTATASANRGVAKFQLGDRSGARADFDRAIGIDREQPKAFYYRGLIKAETGDKQGGIADLQAAAQLYLNNKNTAKYQLTMTKIAELQQK